MIRWPFTRQHSRRYARVAIAGPSMTPTLADGEWWIARLGVPVRPGDLVVMEQPEGLGILVVKRAIRPTSEGWWVEGDNPEASRDSRHFGPVGEESIRGRLLLRYHPLPVRSARRPGG